jgi:hypothetical protein
VGRSKGLILAAMIFAVAMTFIDQMAGIMVVATVVALVGLRAGVRRRRRPRGRRKRSADPAKAV